MTKIYNSLEELIGHTPILALNRFKRKYKWNANVWAKLEFYNPNQNVKDRTALAMIEAAEREGRLHAGDTIIEMTSGNTGIGVAAVAAVKGYKSRIYVQDEASEERIQSIKAFGGEAIRFHEEPFIKKASEETASDFVQIIRKFKENVLSKEKNICHLNQDENIANPYAHESSTGPEIWEDTDGKVDVVVATIGTGGTLTGIAHYLKKKNPAIKTIVVQPKESSRKTKEHPDVEEIAGVHPYDNVPLDEVQASMDIHIVDEKIEVDTWQAKETTREIATTEGILVGTSSGAALFAIKELLKRPEYEQKNIVVIFPDSGLRYLSTDLFEENINDCENKRLEEKG